MMSKHTQGPWQTFEPSTSKLLTVEDMKGNHICSVGHRYNEIVEANANLIAAAPELLEAAKRSQCNCSPLDRDSGHQVGCWMPALANAITKAKGGAE